MTTCCPVSAVLSSLLTVPGVSFAAYLYACLLQVEVKQLASSFGIMPTDEAFHAAGLAFKLVNQPFMEAKASDLTQPFDEVSWPSDWLHSFCHLGNGTLLV